MPPPGSHRPLWLNDSPPATIQDVWDYIDWQLKNLKNKLSTKVEKFFYGGIDSIQFLIHVEEVFKHKHRTKKIKTDIPRLASLRDVDLLTRSTVADRKPGIGIRDAGFSKDLKQFLDTANKTNKLCEDLNGEIEGLYQILHTFCRHYQSLEGEFDLKWARETNLELRNCMKGVTELLESSKAGVVTRLFSSAKFSLEVAETCDTKRYPIIRLYPDIFQKFHTALQLIGKWRAYDQIYLEDVQFKLIRIRRLQRLKHEEYNNLELEHASALGYIVEKRVRVKCRELTERMKLIDRELERMNARKRAMIQEKNDTEHILLDKKRVTYFDRDGNRDKRDADILAKKLKSLVKTLRLNEREGLTKQQEKKELQDELDTLRQLISRSNQLAFERTELSKEMDVLSEKVQELESIYFRKTDRHKLNESFEKSQEKMVR